MPVELQTRHEVNTLPQPAAPRQEEGQAKQAEQAAEAMRKDMVILSSKLKEAAVLEEMGRGSKDGEKAPENQPRKDRQDAVRFEWSRFVEMVMENLKLVFPETHVTAVPVTQIDWGRLLAWSPNPDASLAENMLELFLLYQELHQAILQTTSGTQQQELLARLELLMAAKLERLFQVCMKDLYWFLAGNGQMDAAQALRPSLREAASAAAHAKAAPPRQANEASATRTASAYADTSKVQATSAELRTAAGLSRLRELEAASPRTRAFQGGREGPRFTAVDLHLADRFVKHLPPPSYPVAAASPAGKALAEIDRGMLSLKATVFSSYTEASPALSNVLQQAVSFMAAQVKEHNFTGVEKHSASVKQAAAPILQEAKQASPQASALSGMQQQASASESARAGSPARQMPDSGSSAAYMKKAFSQREDIQEAVLAGLRHALAQQDTSVPAKEQRKNIRNIWHILLTANGKQSAGEEGNRPAPFQLLRENWNQFLQSLGLDRDRYASLYFAAYYGSLLPFLAAHRLPVRPAALLLHGLSAALLLFVALFPPLLAYLSGNAPSTVAAAFAISGSVSAAAGWLLRKRRETEKPD